MTMARVPDPLPAPLLRAWRDFLAASGRDPAMQPADVFHFADNEADATELGALVLAGTKQATASLVWTYAAAGDPLPAAGDLSVVTAWSGAPLCIIETTSVEIHGFDDVPAGFAAAEGEGDGSLAHWRRVHWDYFSRECATLGREPGHDMPVVCERFAVVHRIA